MLPSQPARSRSLIRQLSLSTIAHRDRRSEGREWIKKRSALRKGNRLALGMHINHGLVVAKSCSRKIKKKRNGGVFWIYDFFQQSKEKETEHHNPSKCLWIATDGPRRKNWKKNEKLRRMKGGREKRDVLIWECNIIKDQKSFFFFFFSYTFESVWNQMRTKKRKLFLSTFFCLFFSFSLYAYIFIFHSIIIGICAARRGGVYWWDAWSLLGNFSSLSPFLGFLLCFWPFLFFCKVLKKDILTLLACFSRTCREMASGLAW